MPLEFVPDRRYRWFDNLGEHIGTFVEMRRNAFLIFRDIVTIVDTADCNEGSVPAGEVYDAEPWLQQLDFADTKFHEFAKAVAIEARKREAVIVERCERPE